MKNKQTNWMRMMGLGLAAVGVLVPVLARHSANVSASAAVIRTAPYFMQVNQTLALRSQPSYGKNIEVREQAGQELWVLSGGTYRWWHVQDAAGKTGYVVRNKAYASPSSTAGSTPQGMVWNQTTSQLPPDTTYDPSLTPLAAPDATWEQKFAAVMFVAESKLGTPYRLYHNEDRGQYGFDCSNYAAYVYHHALGISMTGSSQKQYKLVGWTVPNWQKRPGDLLIFEHGAHVGIYVGNDEMIEEGGGLGKVGYLSVAPGSTWGDRLTCVKRIF